MATQTTLLAGMAPELRTFYDRNLLERLLPLLVFMSFGQVRPMPSHEGQTVNYRRFNALPLALVPLTEGVTPGNETPTVTQLVATPLQYGDWIETSDILDFTAPDPVLTEFGQLLAEQAAQSLDTITRDVLVAGTTVQLAGGGAARINVAAANVLNVAEVRKAVRTLQTNRIAKVTNQLSVRGEVA